MIRIYLGSELFYRSASEELALIGPKLSMEANKAGTLTFTIPPDHPFKDSISLLNSIFHVYQDSSYVWSGYPVDIETDFYNQKVVTCEGCLAWLNDVILDPATYNTNPGSVVSSILSAYNAQATTARRLTAGAVTMTGNVNFTHEHTSAMDAVVAAQTAAGGYFRVNMSNNALVLDWLYDSPHTSAQTIKIGKNLIDIMKKNEGTEIVTRLVPLGAKTGATSAGGGEARLDITSVNSGKNYLDSSLVSTYGVRSAVEVFDDIENAADLMSAGQAWLTANSVANMVLEVEAYDISWAESDVESFRILDKIKVISSPHGISETMMLTKMEMQLDDPSGNVITLGTEKQTSMSQQSRATANSIQNMANGVITSSAMESAIAAATSLITGAEGGHIKIVYDNNGEPQQILIMDANTEAQASKIWRWNVNGLGYSNDGGQTYALAMTANGQIVADFIVAGVLQSVNGNYSLDLETGAAVLKDATITGGSIDIQTDDDTTDRISLWYTNPNTGVTEIVAMNSGAFQVQERGTNLFNWVFMDSDGMTVLNGDTQIAETAYYYSDMAWFTKIGEAGAAIYERNQAYIRDNSGNYVKLLPGSLQFFDSNNTLLGEYPASGYANPVTSLASEELLNPTSGDAFAWSSTLNLAVGKYLIIAEAVNGGSYSYARGRIGLKVGYSTVRNESYYFNGAPSDSTMTAVYYADISSATTAQVGVWVYDHAGKWNVSIKAIKMG